jgi:hypothetical protein
MGQPKARIFAPTRAPAQHDDFGPGRHEHDDGLCWATTLAHSAGPARHEITRSHEAQQPTWPSRPDIPKPLPLPPKNPNHFSSHLARSPTIPSSSGVTPCCAVAGHHIRRPPPPASHHHIRRRLPPLLSRWSTPPPLAASPFMVATTFAAGQRL